MGDIPGFLRPAPAACTRLSMTFLELPRSKYNQCSLQKSFLTHADCSEGISEHGKSWGKANHWPHLDASLASSPQGDAAARGDNPYRCATKRTKKTLEHMHMHQINEITFFQKNSSTTKHKSNTRLKFQARIVFSRFKISHHFATLRTGGSSERPYMTSGP